MPIGRIESARRRCTGAVECWMNGTLGVRCQFSTGFSPRLGNRVGFFIAKPLDESELHPWIRRKGDGFDLRDEWAKERYKV